MGHPFVIEAPKIHTGEGFADMVISIVESIFTVVAGKAARSFFDPQECIEMVECHFTWNSDSEPRKGMSYQTEFAVSAADDAMLERHHATQGQVVRAEADEYECSMVIVSRAKHLLN